MTSTNQVKPVAARVTRTQSQQQLLLQTALVAANAGVFRVDLKKGTISLDKRACELMGMPQVESEIQLSQWAVHLHEEDRERVLEAFSSTGASVGNQIELRFRVTREPRNVNNKGVAVIDLKGGTAAAESELPQEALLGIIWDVTKHAQREREEFEQHKKRAQTAEELCIQKQELIDTVCHEIRNPLQGVVGATVLLRDDLSRAKEELLSVPSAPTAAAAAAAAEAVTPRDETELFESAFMHLDTIEECTRQQKLIADEVLDFSRLASGQIEIRTESVDVKALFRSLTTMFASVIQLRNLKTAMHIQSAHVLLDQQRVTQILVNLLSNAIKYSPTGGSITITAWWTSGSLHVTIQDTGIGMDEQTIATLFQRFKQVNPSVGGSGLGLSITKRLLDAMNGQIKYSSAKGQGTTVYVCMPAPSAPPAIESCSSSSGALQQASTTTTHNRKLATPLHVLIADDNEINRRILGRFLEDLGCTHEDAINGEEAVELFRQHQDRIDVCMLDFRMPGITGIEAAVRIRKLSQQQNRQRSLRVIGVSGDATQKENASAAGMDDYILKPYSRSTILEVLACTNK